jgi:hypothetical protein
MKSDKLLICTVLAIVLAFPPAVPAAAAPSQRLRQNAKVFLNLPEDQRQRIVRLDHDLQQEAPAAQARLEKVLERYAAWLDQLDAKDRQRVQETADKRARLEIIRELRDRDWMKQQPKALRDQYAMLPADKKRDFVTKLRGEERQRRLDWKIAERFWKELDKGATLPCRLTDFPPDVQSYVNDYLRPMLSKDEEDRLEKAAGQWPLYPMTLVELADQHPPALPGPKGPQTFDELPPEVRNRFKQKNGAYLPKLVKAQKRWPDFAIELSKYISGKKGLILPHELWAWGQVCLSPQMKEFVDKKLLKELDRDELQRLLHDVEGKWPDYPLAIQELARKYHLQVPWHTLPGTRERWDNYRLPHTE